MQRRLRFRFGFGGVAVRLAGEPPLQVAAWILFDRSDCPRMSKAWNSSAIVSNEGVTGSPVNTERSGPLRGETARSLPDSRSRLRNLLLTLPFVCLYLVDLAHHRIWRDEINAWAIACVSPNLPNLLHRVHYEAHPALWYLILYPGSRITHALWMLKLVQGVIAVGIFLMLALTTPFRRLELLLILLGSYLMFQYTVMARMYGLELLFALAYAWFRMKRPEWVLRNTIWLGLMANVDLTGAILGGGLLLEYLEDRYRQGKENGRVEWGKLTGAVGVFAALFAISVASLWPAKDISWSTTGHAGSLLFSTRHLLESVLKWSVQPWYPGSIAVVSSWADFPYALYLVLGAVFVGCLCIAFRRQIRLGLMLALIFLTGVLFSQALTVAGVRHTGILYVALLVALWMMRYKGEAVSRFVYVLLGATAICGVWSLYQQWSKPFTDDDATVAWIQQQHLENAPIFGAPDTNVIGVPERLARPLYSLNCDCSDEVLTFRNTRDAFRMTTGIPPGVQRALQDLHTQSGLLLLNRRLKPGEEQKLGAEGIRAQPLASFEQGLLADEHFYVYRASLGGPPSADEATSP